MMLADISIQPGDLVISLDREGRIASVNDEAAATFGYAVEQMVGVPLEVLCPKLQSGPVIFDVEAIIAGRDFVGGFESARRDGTPLSLYMYATAGRISLPRGGKGTVVGVLCVAREVTAFWQAEEAVRASREKYRLLFDLSPDIVVLTTTAGRIIEANQAVSRLSGYSVEQLKRMTVMDLVPAGSERKAELVLAGLWKRKQLKAALDFQVSDGSTIVVEFNASVSRVDGKPMVFAIGRDVSDRLQMETAAKEIGEKYERMFSAIRDAVYLETVDGRILDVNEAASEMLGYTRDELLNMSAGDLMPEEARAWLPNIREAIMREGDFTVEAVNVRKDGTEIPVEVRCSRMELGGRTLVLVMARDIADRKASELAVRQSEEQLRTLQENVPVGLFRASAEGKLLRVNSAAVDIFGYGTAEEMTARSVADLYANAGEQRTLVKKLVTDGQLSGVETRLKRKDGSQFWGVLDVRASADEAGKAQYFDGTIQDISSRRKAEQALMESEENFRALAGNANDGIFVTNAAGRFVYSNRMLSELSGYTAEEITGLGIADLAHPEELKKIEDRFSRRMLGESVPTQYETALLAKDGRRVPVEITAARTEWRGEAADMVVLRDISERQEHERRLRGERDRAQRYLDVAGTMIVALDEKGNVSLANPAACKVLGWSPGELVGRNWFDCCLPEDVREDVKTVYRRLMAGEMTPVKVYCNPVQTKSGETRTVEWTNTVLNDSEGAIIGTLSSGADVTERLRIEEVLRASEEKYRVVVERAKDGIAVVVDGKLAFVNSALVRLSGHTKDELHGVPFADFLTPGQSEILSEMYAKRMAGKPLPRTYETVFAHGDGHEVEIEVTAGRTVYEGKPADLVFVRDITERKRATRDLEESHRALATLMSNLPGMAYRCRNDHNWTMEFASQGAAALTGYSPDDFAEKRRVSFAELIHPLDRKFVWEEVQRAIQDREPFKLTYRIKTASGATKWVWEQGRGVFAEDGSLIALEGLVTDVTDRKAAEEEARQSLDALRASKERYSTLFMGTPIGMYRTTPEGQVLMANPALVSMLGYDSFWELRSRNLEQDGFQPSYRRVEFKTRLESEGEITGLETDWTRKDGSTVHVRENARVVRGDAGEVLYYEGTVEDITQVKRSTEALRDREARLGLMVRQMPAVLWTIDTDLVFTSSVGTGLSALGLKPGQAVGMSLFDYFNTRDPEFPAIAAHRRALRGETAEYTFEWSGNVYQNRVEPLQDADGETIGAIGIAYDMTHQARAEGRTEALLESMPQSVVYQTGGGAEYVSPNVLGLLGYPAEEFTRDREFFPSLIHPEDRERVAGVFKDWLESGANGPLVQEFRVRTKGGDYLWIADHARLAYRTEDGKTSTLGVLVDTTEQRRTGRELRASEQRYRALFEELPYGAAVYQDGKVVLANRAMAEMLGYRTNREVIGLPVTAFIHPQDKPHADERERTLLTGTVPAGATEPLSVRFLRSDGTTIPVEVVGSLVEWGGKPAVQVVVRPGQSG